MAEKLVPFEYVDLTPELADTIKAVAERIRLRLKKTAEDIIAIGQDLLSVKENLPHGHFTPWLQAEFDISERTARRFMNVAELFAGKAATVSLLSPKALYELAAPSTYDTLRQEIMERLAKGESVTAKEIQELKKQAQQEREQRQEAECQMITLEGHMQKAQSRISELNNMLAELQSQPPKVIEKEKIPEGYKTVHGAIRGLESRKIKLEKEVQEHQEQLSTLAASVERRKQLHNFQRQLKHLRDRLVGMENIIEEDRLLAFISASDIAISDELQAMAAECDRLAGLIRRKLSDPRSNVVDVQAEQVDH